jgi:hypothetical protein
VKIGGFKMDKVLLPKEVADAIHYFLVKGREKSLFNVPTIASSSAKNKRYKTIFDYIQSSDENFKKYFNALVNGYEVEFTKEERLKNYYESCLSNKSTAKVYAIEHTLYLLGIEIEGVNK